MTALAVTLCCTLPTAPAAPADCATVTEIAPGVHLRAGRDGVPFEADDVANVGFVVGEACVAVIDSGGSRREGEALDCAIRRTTDRPVCYVINSHSHPDHVLGNAAFQGPGVRFVGHHRLPRDLALRGSTYLNRARQAGDPQATLIPPDLTVTDTLELDLGGRRLTVAAQPTAHSSSDLSIYDPQTGLLWLADLLFVEHLPVVDGSVAGWIAVLDQLVNHPATQVVPGHGPAPLDWPQARGYLLRYLTTLRDETRDWLEQGGSLVKAQEEVAQGERGRWTLFDFYHPRNVIAAYTELEWE